MTCHETLAKIVAPERKTVTSSSEINGCIGGKDILTANLQQ
jgi:hypothetical protein